MNVDDHKSSPGLFSDGGYPYLDPFPSFQSNTHLESLVCEAARPQGGASRKGSFVRIVPLDPAYKAGLAGHLPVRPGTVVLTRVAAFVKKATPYERDLD